MIKGGQLCRDLKPGQSRVLRARRRLGGSGRPKARPVWVVAACLASGELLIAVTNAEPKQALATYASRREIETLFAAMKTCGFNLEDTHMTNHERVSKLVAVLAIAFCWAHKLGDWLHEAKPIRLKSHERPAKSIFRYGFDQIRRHLVNTPVIRQPDEGYESPAIRAIVIAAVFAEWQADVVGGPIGDHFAHCRVKSSRKVRNG
jgi:hypothetical protein